MAVVRSAVIPPETPQPLLAPSMPLADIGAWGSRRLLGGKGKLHLFSAVLNDVVLHSAVIWFMHVVFFMSILAWIHNGLAATWNAKKAFLPPPPQLLYCIHRVCIVNKQNLLCKINNVQMEWKISLGLKPVTSPKKTSLPMSDLSLKSNFSACWKRQMLSCPLKASLMRCYGNWTDIKDENLNHITKLLGLPVKEDSILLMVFSCVFLNKKQSLFYCYYFCLF